MFSYGPGFPHFLIIMLVGFLWILVLAVIAAILFLVIRFAVLSALKTHTRWSDAGKPDGSAWSQRPAPHPGFVTDAAPAPVADVAPAAAPDAVAPVTDVVTEPETSSPPVPPKAPAKPRTPRAPKKP